MYLCLQINCRLEDFMILEVNQMEEDNKDKTEITSEDVQGAYLLFV